MQSKRLPGGPGLLLRRSPEGYPDMGIYVDAALNGLFVASLDYPAGGDDVFREIAGKLVLSKELGAIRGGQNPLSRECLAQTQIASFLEQKDEPGFLAECLAAGLTPEQVDGLDSRQTRDFIRLKSALLKGYVPLGDAKEVLQFWFPMERLRLLGDDVKDWLQEQSISVPPYTFRHLGEPFGMNSTGSYVPSFDLKTFLLSEPGQSCARRSGFTQLLSWLAQNPKEMESMVAAALADKF